MTKKKVDHLQAVRASDQVRVLIEPIVCPYCEAVCWSVEGKATGRLGTDSWETALLYRDHVPLSDALAAMAATVGRLAQQERSAEERQYLLEHHPRLW